MENSKLVSKEFYRNHVLCFTEQRLPVQSPQGLAEGNAGPDAHADLDTHAGLDVMCIGEVFRADERIAYCESLDKDSARQYCRQIVDTSIARSSAAQPAITPEQTDLAPVLRSIAEQLDSQLRGVLQAHLNHQNAALSINTLKQAGKFESTTAVYLAYAELARLLCDALNHIPVPTGNGQDPYLNMIIETVEPDLNSSDSLAVRLKPSIYRALEPFFST